MRVRPPTPSCLRERVGLDGATARTKAEGNASVGRAVAGPGTATAGLRGALPHRPPRPRPSGPDTPARQALRRRQWASRGLKPRAAADRKVSDLRQTALDRGPYRVRADEDVSPAPLSAGCPLTSSKVEISALELPRQLGGLVALLYRGRPASTAEGRGPRPSAGASSPPVQSPCPVRA